MEAEGLCYFPEGGSYRAFIEGHLLKNEPCLFGEWATRSWGARSKWVMQDGSPNFAYLSKEFGHAKVSVADCGKSYFSTHPKVEMTLVEYLEYWQSHDCEVASQDSKLSENCDDQLLYLKDWHFVQDFPKEEDVSYSPHFFMHSDWLNEVWRWREDVTDDYRFVYMGPAGTWTPFHADVLRSYSWSANITGSKEWLFFPPKQEDMLRDKFGNLPFDVTSSEKILSGLVPPPLKVIQRRGEIIFVPSGWHHQVRNLEPTISINHNWNNAFCLPHMWDHLQQELHLVEKELQDCLAMEGWHEHCQLVLKASVGMDYWEFAQFIVTLALPRLHQFKNLVQLQWPSSSAETFATLKQFIQDVKTDTRHRISFFKDGKFPEASLTSMSMPDNMVDSLSACEELVAALPWQLQQLLVEEKCTDQSKISVLVYIAFEVDRLTCVAEKVSKTLKHLSEVT